MRPLVAPETQPPEPPVSRCMRSCCWTPYGHTPQPNCTCHEGDPMSDRVPLPQLRKLTARDGHACVWTAQDTERLVPQHRQGGMGGRANKHRLVNLLWLDSIINGLIEDDADWAVTAKAWGIKVSLHVDPARVPVFFAHEHAWFMLTDDTRQRITAVEATKRMHDIYGDDFYAWMAVAQRSSAYRALYLRGAR